MPEENINPQSEENKNAEQHENSDAIDNERFESDTQKVVRRHLQNENDIITDEDIANIRVGMVPTEFDKATEARFEGDDAREEVENKFTDGTKDTDKDNNLDKGPITPWDTLDTDR